MASIPRPETLGTAAAVLAEDLAHLTTKRRSRAWFVASMAAMAAARLVHAAIEAEVAHE